KINDWGGVEREDLAQDEATDDGDTQRTAQFGANAGAKSKRQAGKERGHSGHHDRTKTKQARFVNRIHWSFPFVAIGFERKVNHHDGVFLNDADEKNDTDERDDAELRPAKKKRENGANSGGRKRRKDRDGMDETFVENAENNVNRNQRGQNENRFVGQ